MEGGFSEVQPHVGGCPDPLSWIEIFVTLCGMVGLRAMVLGRLGRKPSPHPRACALSCPSPAIRGPGSLGHLTRPALSGRDPRLYTFLNGPRPFFLPLFTGVYGRALLRTPSTRSSQKLALLLRLGSLPDYGDRAVGVPYHRLRHAADQGPPYPSVAPAAHHYQPDPQTLGQVDDLLVCPS